MNEFGENLKALRSEQNLSRRQLGAILNVSERLVSYWENGARECNFDMLIKIADFSTSHLIYCWDERIIKNPYKKPRLSVEILGFLFRYYSYF